MRVGIVILPEQRWATAVERWRRAEALGFDHAWTYDHLAWRGLRDAPWFSSVPVLAAAATATSRIRLGTLVASPNLRHPALLARDVITLDDLSAGRFVLGFGAGGTGWDADVLGLPRLAPADRVARLDEHLELLDRLLREGEASYDGRFVTAVGARARPGCVQQPRVPFAVAAGGPRAMRVAARYGQAWVTTGERDHRGPSLDAAAGAAAVARQVADLDAACAAEGRDPSALDRMVLTGLSLDDGLSSAAAFAEVRAAYAAAGVTDLVVHWPRPDEPYAGDDAVLEQLELG